MSEPGLAALRYARRGWAVFPCHTPGTAGCSCAAGASCTSPGKHPRTRRGLHDASSDPDVVARWWRAWPLANVGLRTGAGLVVVDVDPAHGGMAALADLEAAHGRFPPTAAVRTGGAGLHLYFAAEAPVRNSAGVLGPGIDIRGDGGYVIAPPSRHASGSPYRWSGTGPLAPLPAWVTEALARPAPERVVLDPAGLRPRPGASAWAAAAVSGEVDRVVAAAEGARNHTLNRSAFVLGQLVGAGHLQRDEVADVLTRAGCCAGLGEREVAATVASGLSAGERWPRHPSDRPVQRGCASAGIDLRAVDLPSGREGPGRSVGLADGITP